MVNAMWQVFRGVYRAWVCSVLILIPFGGVKKAQNHDFLSLHKRSSQGAATIWRTDQSHEVWNDPSRPPAVPPYQMMSQLIKCDSPSRSTSYYLSPDKSIICSCPQYSPLPNPRHNIIIQFFPLCGWPYRVNCLELFPGQGLIRYNGVGSKRICRYIYCQFTNDHVVKDYTNNTLTKLGCCGVVLDEGKTLGRKTDNCYS